MKIRVLVIATFLTMFHVCTTTVQQSHAQSIKSDHKSATAVRQTYQRRINNLAKLEEAVRFYETVLKTNFLLFTAGVSLTALYLSIKKHKYKTSALLLILGAFTAFLSFQIPASIDNLIEFARGSE